MSTTMERTRTKARPEVDALVDLSNVAEKRGLVNQIAPLTGVYEVTLKPKRDTRTLRQLRWWWSCIVKPFYDYLKEQDYGVCCPEDAHDELRKQFLRTPFKVDRVTGEVKRWRVKRTRELSPAEFGEFAEKSQAWLAQTFGIVTESPDPNWRNNQ